MTERLAVGERVIWEGRPSLTRFVLTPSVIALTFFFLLFLVLPFLAIFTAPTSTRDLGSAVVLAFPVVMFALIIVLPGVLPAWLEGRRTRYVLTDRRAEIHGWRHEVEIDLATCGHVEFDRSLLGTTSIYFGSRDPLGGWAWGIWGYGRSPAFRAIVEGERVYRLVTEARQGLRQR